MDAVRYTDPATQLADLCDRLSSGGHKVSGDEYLARCFGVDAWSEDFWQIVFAIQQRISFVEKCVEGLGGPEDQRHRALNHLAVVRSGFDRQSMLDPWHSTGSTRLGPRYADAIRMLGFALSRSHPIADLSDQQAEAIRADVAELLNWLEEIQLSDRDFIRQNLIDGLKAFEFRLKHLQWVGWGHALEGLKEVLSAYLILEGFADPAQRPDAGAIIAKSAPLLKKIWSIIDAAKDTTEKVDWLLRFYGVVSLANQGQLTIAGLLT